MTEERTAILRLHGIILVPTVTCPIGKVAMACTEGVLLYGDS